MAEIPEVAEKNDCRMDAPVVFFFFFVNFLFLVVNSLEPISGSD